MTHQRAAHPDSAEDGFRCAGNREDVHGYPERDGRGRHTSDRDLVFATEAADTAAIEDALHTALRGLHPNALWVLRLAESLTEAARAGASPSDIEIELRHIIDQTFPGRSRHIDVIGVLHTARACSRRGEKGIGDH